MACFSMGRREDPAKLQEMQETTKSLESKLIATTDAMKTHALAHEISPSSQDSVKAPPGSRSDSHDGNKERMERMELFFRCKDISFLREVFKRHEDVETGMIPQNRLVNALRELGYVGLSEDSLREIFYDLDTDGDSGVSFEEFCQTRSLPSATERWLSTLRVPSLLARCLPMWDEGKSQGSIGEGLRGLCAALKPDDIAKSIEIFSQGLQKLLEQSVEELRKGYDELDRKSAELAKAQAACEDAVSKFRTFKMASGNIREYHKGMQDRIGFPNPDVAKGMRAEHTVMFGADLTFVTTNYGIKTTPRREYEIAVGERECTEAEMLDRSGRRVRCVRALAELRREGVCVAAGLIDTEIVSVMFNTMLRQYPPKIFDEFQKGGNLYSTTTHVIVSAISKIAQDVQTVKIPSKLKLFRGLGGLMELPDIFMATDKQGCRGYMEFGFLSTTQNEQVAMEYSGVKEGHPNAMVLEMETDSVNRGACVCDLSQYPGEREFLWPPCSFLEPEGHPIIRVMENGEVLTSVPVKICKNLKTLHVEQLVSQKKDLYLTSARYTIEHLKIELEDIARLEGAYEKVANDPHRVLKGTTYTVEMFVDKLVWRVRQVLAKQEERAPEDFLHEDILRRISLEMLDAQKHAISSLRYYIENSTALINGSVNLPLIFGHRYYLAFLRKAMHAKDGPARQAVALRLCKASGVVDSEADEVNWLNEPRIIEASYEGNVSSLRLLAAAGASVNAVCEGDGWTPLICAASSGHPDAVELLCDLGANLEAGNRTPLVSACFYGMASTVTVLLRRGANPDAADSKGATGLLLAAMKNHLEVVKILCRKVKNIDNGDSSGSTPLMFAAEYGHVEVVKELLACKADPVNVKNSSGAQPLHIATNFGHLETVKVLCESMQDIDVPRSDGRTPLLCASICSEKSSISIMEMLLGRGATVDRADQKGATPLLLAAMKGFTDRVELLAAKGVNVDHVDALGYTPLMLAAKNGHLAAVEVLCRLGANTKLTREGTGNGTTTAKVLAEQGGFTTVVECLRKFE